MKLDAGLVFKIIGFYLLFKKKEPKPGIKPADTMLTTQSIKETLPQTTTHSTPNKPALTSAEIEALMNNKGF